MEVAGPMESVGHTTPAGLCFRWRLTTVVRVTGAGAQQPGRRDSIPVPGVPMTAVRQATVSVMVA